MKDEGKVIYYPKYDKITKKLQPQRDQTGGDGDAGGDEQKLQETLDVNE